MVCPLQTKSFFNRRIFLLDESTDVWNLETVGTHDAGLSSYDSEQGNASGVVPNDLLDTSVG